MFHDRVEGLCEQARDLASAPDPGRALADWLRSVAVYRTTTRGLAASLLAAAREPAPPPDGNCEVLLRDAGGALLRQAQDAGAVRSDVAIDDLLTMVNAVSLATEDGPNAARLVALAIDGIHERPRPAAVDGDNSAFWPPSAAPRSSA